MRIYPKYARIGKTDHVCNIEDQRKHDDRDEPVTSCDKSEKGQNTQCNSLDLRQIELEQGDEKETEPEGREDV